MPLDLRLEKDSELSDPSQVAYFVLGTDGIIQRVNHAGGVLIGRDPQWLAGRMFQGLLARKLQPAFRLFLEGVFQSRSRQFGDFALSGRESRRRMVSVQAEASPDGLECRATVQDITERCQAEDRVRISEIRYRRLFEAAQDGVLLLDPITRKITDANPFMTHLLGFTHGQLVGKELFEIGLLQDEAASRKLFRKLVRCQQVRYENLPLQTRSGARQEVEVVANLYQENDSAVIQCNIRDISERRLAAEILERNEALFSSLVTQSPVGVYVVDSLFRLCQANPLARAAFRSIRPLVGHDFSEVLRKIWPSRIAARLERTFRDTLKTGTAHRSPEFVERRRDTGVEEAYEWQTQRVTLPAGKFGVVCFFTEVTERRQAEANRLRLGLLAASNRKLEAEVIRRRKVEASLKKSQRHHGLLLGLSRDLQGQLRRLSHGILKAQEEERKRISRELHDEITQILVGINVGLDTLSREAVADPARVGKSIRRTQSLVERSVRIVHRFARELRPPALDDLGLIASLQSHLREFMGRTGIRVGFSVQTGVESLSALQRAMLYRVIQEALNNVSRHAQASRVEVSIRRETRQVIASIADNGKSFDTDQELRPRRSGRLGLIGMRERVEMLGGRFSIHSKPGQGTTVVARIPVRPPRTGQDPSPASS
jgi:PAS domain S-box-containing protein